MQGLVFGIIDNGIMIIGAFFGLSMEKFFPKKLQVGLGAIVGAGLANAVSDFLGGVGERNIELAFGTFFGCLIALIFIPIIVYIKGKIKNEKNQI